jgi:hypothetical protein
MAGPEPAQAHFFLARMDDHLPGWIDDQLPESVERARRERVNQDETLGRRYLHKTQVRVKRVFADKLGVETESRARRQILATGLQVASVSDDLFFGSGHSGEL